MTASYFFFLSASDDPSTEFNLKTYANPKDLRNAIEKIPQKGGLSNVGRWRAACTASARGGLWGLEQDCASSLGVEAMGSRAQCQGRAGWSTHSACNVPSLVQAAASPSRVARSHLSSHGQIPLMHWWPPPAAVGHQAGANGAQHSCQRDSGGAGTSSGDFPACSHSPRNHFPQLSVWL